LKETKLILVNTTFMDLGDITLLLVRIIYDHFYQ